MGCARWKAFLRITLPLSMPGVLAGLFCLHSNRGDT